MSMDNEIASGNNEELPLQTKTDLDIYRLLNQMGIYPDRWLLFEKIKNDHSD
ncbi:hypothetical protein [Paenibacillus dakarensis]|uniref:hypothetical protein n=1 Tax=Paenibacillus dakarensis TaxID=1527293 RepID=UPI000A66D05D|nr:hypothetical protein [Paenibacillus dakarensis]